MRQDKGKLILHFGAAALAVAVLAGCGDIQATPTSGVYNEDLLNFSDGSTVEHNTLSRIYDALVTEGDTNSAKVLDNILYIYSQSIYGPFFDVAAADNDGTAIKGLKGVVEEYLADNAKTTDIDAFAASYKVYKAAEASDAATTAAHTRANVINFYNEVMFRINTVFYGYVTNSSYQYRSQFQEKLFYDAQVKSYYDLAKVAENSGDVYSSEYVQVEGSFRLVGDETIDSVSMAKYFTNLFYTYQNYIEITVLPDIYRNELTSQYLYGENFGTLRMTSARKVDYIKLAENGQYSYSVLNLMQAYCKEVIDGTYTVSGVSYGLINKYGFPFLNALYKGTAAEYVANLPTADQAGAATMANTIYGDAGWTTSSVTIGSKVFSTYAQSSLGTIITSYNKIKDNRFDDDATVRSDFTGTGAYTVETGFDIKYQSLLSTNATANGWYIAGGLDALPASLKDRAFLVQVANEVDTVSDTAVHELQYGWYVGGNYYLTPANYETSTAYPYLVTDGTNYYLVKVDEAVKAAKITAATSTNTAESLNYDDVRSTYGVAQEIARKVAYSLSSSDTWKKAAKTYFVNEMALIYHDSYVYDYFKTTFPDLFS
jgi:hypothetical protein